MICKNCNNKNIDGVQFCFYCGHKLKSEDDQKSENNIDSSMQTKNTFGKQSIQQPIVTNQDDFDSKSQFENTISFRKKKTLTTTENNNNLKNSYESVNKNKEDNTSFDYGDFSQASISPNKAKSVNKTVSVNKKVAVISSCIGVALIAIVGVVFFSLNNKSNNRTVPSKSVSESVSQVTTSEIQQTTGTFSKNTYDSRIVDNGNILSDYDEDRLYGKLKNFSEMYNMDIVEVTVDNLEGKTAQEYADDFYDNNNYGYGNNKDGILFLICVNEQKWAISTCGKGIQVFNDNKLDELSNDFQLYLSCSEYFETFAKFADSCKDILSENNKDEYAKEHGYKRIEDSDLTLYADSKNGKMTLIDWGLEFPNVAFETDKVCFGKNGLADSYENKFVTPKGSFKLGSVLSNEKIQIEVSENSEIFIVEKNGDLQDNSGNIKICKEDFDQLVSNLNESRNIYIVIY